MAVQTTYNDRHAPAYAGMLASAEWLKNIVSRTAVNAAIPFGAPVLIGGVEDTVTTVGDADSIDTSVFLGISVRDQSVDPSSPNEYREGDNVAVLTHGVIWVVAAAAVDQGDAVYYTPTGTLTNASGGNTAITGATWDSSAGSGDLARVRLG